MNNVEKNRGKNTQNQSDNMVDFTYGRNKVSYSNTNTNSQHYLERTESESSNQFVLGYN